MSVHSGECCNQMCYLKMACENSLGRGGLEQMCVEVTTGPRNNTVAR